MLTYLPTARRYMSASKNSEYVDPLPQEFDDSVDAFIRDVIERASEIPRNELDRLIKAERERQWPYIQKENKAMREYLAAMVGIDPKEFKGPAEFSGCLKDFFGPDFDPVEAVRAVRGRGP